MTIATRRRRPPAITLARSDHERLANLADAFAGRDSPTADQLAAELERARVVADNRLAPGTVRMGAVVRFSLDDAEPRTVRLVYPGDADIEKGWISRADAGRRRADRAHGWPEHRLDRQRQPTTSPPCSGSGGRFYRCVRRVVSPVGGKGATARRARARLWPKRRHCRRRPAPILRSAGGARPPPPVPRRRPLPSFPPSGWTVATSRPATALSDTVATPPFAATSPASARKPSTRSA